GHVDYWDVGPAVLRNIVNVNEGDPVTMEGQNGGEYVYSVEYVERVTLSELTSEKLQEITGPTPYGALTIVTCGGEFDYNAGEYLQRDIIRCRLDMGDDDEDASADTPEDTGGTDAPAGELAEGARATV